MECQKGGHCRVRPFSLSASKISGHHEASTSAPQPSHSPPNFCSRCAEKLNFSVDLIRSLRLGKLYTPPRCLRCIHRLTGDAVATGDQEVSVQHLPFMRRKICEMVYRSRFAAIVPLLRIDRPLSVLPALYRRTGAMPQTPNNIEGGGTSQQNSGPCVTAGARLKKQAEGPLVSVEGDHPLAGRQVLAIDRHRNLRRARLAADGNVSSLAVERDPHRETAPVFRQRR